jgi:RNA polymerase sigma-B factor
VEDAACPGPDDPVDDQVTVGLQLAHGRVRQGSEPTVGAGGADRVPALYEGALQRPDPDARVAAHAAALPEDERVSTVGGGDGAGRGDDDQGRRQQRDDDGPDPGTDGDRRWMRHWPEPCHRRAAPIHPRAQSRMTSRDITWNFPTARGFVRIIGGVDRSTRKPQPGIGDARGREIEGHLPLVSSVARRYAGEGEPFEDLVQAGTIGLIKAVDRFDSERGVAFSTYAVPVIEGEIRHHLRDCGRLVRVPRPVTELDARLSHAERDLTASLARAPTADELAGAMGVPVDAVADAVAARAAARTETLPADLEDDRGGHATSEARVLLRRGWQELGERERRILELRFFDDLTQAQIAKEVGLSQAHVSRLIADALERLRSSLHEGVAGPDTAAYSAPEMASADDTRAQGSSHSGRLLVRMPQSLHAELARTAEHEGVSLNALVTSALASAVGWRNGEPAEDETDAPPTPPAPAAESPRRWSSVALIANLIVVVLAAAVAIALLVAALSQG